MGFTPPPEKLGHAVASGLLTASFLAAARAITFDGGAVRDVSGERRWPLIVEGRWTWSAAARAVVTLATYRLLVDAAAQSDGSAIVDGRTWWLVDVELCDGTRLAVCVPA